MIMAIYTYTVMGRAQPEWQQWPKADDDDGDNCYIDNEDDDDEGER